MAKRMGDRLDVRVFRQLSGADGAAPAGEAILIATTDDRGRPHPALLSFGEVLAVTPAVLRFAVSGGSTTARNLADRGAVTLCLIGADGAVYVKAEARPLTAETSLQEDGLVAFEARIEDVLADTPAAGEDARLTSGITFAAADPDAHARTWAARRAALRRA